jgi:AraC-like DNA-binding protein
VLDLCSALNVRIRTLYYAFQEFYGVSPIKYLRLVRYARARRDLLIAAPENTTVTDVAAKWHFWHFGRFSIEYKSLFGESPSETLNNEKKIIFCYFLTRGFKSRRPRWFFLKNQESRLSLDKFSPLLFNYSIILYYFFNIP